MAGQSLTEGYLDGFKVSTVLRLASSCISLYTSLMSHSGTSGTFLEMEFLDQKFFIFLMILIHIIKLSSTQL